MGDAVAARVARAAAEKMPDAPSWPDEWVAQVTAQSTGKKARLTAALRLIQRGQYAQAVSLLQQMAPDYPDAADAHHVSLLLGRAYFMQRDWAKAAPALRRAAET